MSGGGKISISIVVLEEQPFAWAVNWYVTITGEATPDSNVSRSEIVPTPFDEASSIAVLDNLCQLICAFVTLLVGLKLNREPLHISIPLVRLFTVGIGFTLTLIISVELQPSAFWTITS